MSTIIEPANIAERLTYSECITRCRTGEYGPVYIRNAAIVEGCDLWEGPHHALIIHAIAMQPGFQKPVRGEQGFVLNDGRFIRRKPAFRLAKKNGQFFKQFGNGDQLYSEELWIHRGDYPVARNLPPCPSLPT